MISANQLLCHRLTFVLTIDGNLIRQVNDSKFLGVFIDNNISWRVHIGKIMTKISQTVGVIGRARSPSFLFYITLFENALRLKFGIILTSDDLQFGFKPKYSMHPPGHAVFTLKFCVDYFTKRDSNAYVAFLDFSKAFDTISHCGLFLI